MARPRLRRPRAAPIAAACGLAALLAACADGAAPGPAGAEDAGAADALAADAEDAPRDAGSGGDAAAALDAGPDADAAPTDAAPTDAAPTDAAPTDAAAQDAGPRDPLAGASAAVLVQGRFGFLEGPVWSPAAGVLLFSDLNTSTIFALAPPSTVTSFRTPSGTSNGLALDPAGLLLAAEHASRSVTRTLANGQLTTVADRFGGLRLNSPNDLTVRRSDGTIYFTDPPWGLNGRARELDFDGLFRVAPDGTLTAERRYPTNVNPNGVTLSPDERTLYVALDTDASVMAFDVAADGTLSGERLFVRTAATPDGMAIDADGNLYVADSAGIEVFAPDGARWGAISVAEQPANCAFGGPARTTLYITARTGLYRAELTVPGGE